MSRQFGCHTFTRHTIWQIRVDSLFQEFPSPYCHLIHMQESTKKNGIHEKFSMYSTDWWWDMNGCILQFNNVIYLLRIENFRVPWNFHSIVKNLIACLTQPLFSIRFVTTNFIRANILVCNCIFISTSDLSEKIYLQCCWRLLHSKELLFFNENFHLSFFLLCSL